MGKILYLSLPDDFLADIVAARFRADGHDVDVASAITPGLPIVSGAYDVVIADAAHGDALGLCAMVKRQVPNTRLLVLLPESAARPADFRFEGDESLIEPFEVASMVAAVKRLLADPGLRVRVAFPTTDENVERARGVLEFLINTYAPFDEATKFHLITAIGEAIGNAALHGNKSRRDRLVTLDYTHTPREIAVTIANEGQGFDWRAQLAERAGDSADPVAMARARQQQGKLGGLGLNLMFQVCDSVEFNDPGTAITLKKSLQVTP